MARALLVLVVAAVGVWCVDHARRSEEAGVGAPAVGAVRVSSIVPLVRLGSRPIRTEVGDRHAPVRVWCPPGPAACHGTVVLQHARAPLGRAAYRLSPGRHGDVLVRLGRRARAALAQHCRVRLTVVARTRDSGASGRRARGRVLVTRRVLLLRPRQRAPSLPAAARSVGGCR